MSFKSAYAATLREHHGWMARPLFTAAMSAVPYRKDFYAKLGSDPQLIYEDMAKYLAALANVVAILMAFMATNEAKW